MQGTGVSVDLWRGCQRSVSLQTLLISPPDTLFFSARYSVFKSHCGYCCFRTLQVYVPIRQFFYNLIHPDYSAVTDVYVLMFLADTVDFIIIVFGFWAFGVCHRGHLHVNCQLGPLLLMLGSIWMSSFLNYSVTFSFSETLCSSRHHLFVIRGPGPRGIFGDGTHSVWYHGGRPSAVPQKDCHGKGHLPGHPCFWNSFLDVLYLAWSDRKV